MARKNAELQKSSEFFLGEEIEKLTEGSYENLALRVTAAIRKDEKRLFGEPLSEVKGTFSGYAIAITESSNVFRVKFDRAENGDICAVSAESAGIKKFTYDQFAIREAHAYVDAFMSGSRSSASSHLLRLAPMHLSSKPRTDGSVEGFAKLVESARAWKQVYTEKLSQIRSACEGAEVALDENRMRTKFTKLYDGAIEESAQSDYEGLVTSDLKYLAARFETLTKRVSTAVENYKGVVPALKVNSQDPTIKMFEAFQSDYITDVTSIEKALTEVVSNTNRVDAKGKIYDVLSGALHSYEVAGLFVEKMSQRLVDTEEG